PDIWCSSEEADSYWSILIVLDWGVISLKKGKNMFRGLGKDASCMIGLLRLWPLNSYEKALCYD
ncbi:18563_t:CDS:2, partial [Gigaspora margarita]